MSALAFGFQFRQFDRCFKVITPVRSVFSIGYKVSECLFYNEDQDSPKRFCCNSPATLAPFNLPRIIHEEIKEFSNFFNFDLFEHMAWIRSSVFPS